jgi:SAM-dependent methyltransferase
MGNADELYVNKALLHLRNHGMRRTLRRFAHVFYRDTVTRFGEWRFDRRLGVETGGVVNHPKDSDNPLHRLAVHYQATSPKMFRKIMQSFGCVTAPFTFFDMGCGKGRVLLMASRYGFKGVVGVEFDSALAEIAQENAAHFQRHHTDCSAIEVICSDAATYQFPDEDAVIFFFNPFAREIMEKVLANIKASAKTTKHRYIIYYHPVLETLLNDPAQFALVARTRRYAIYRMQL